MVTPELPRSPGVWNIGDREPPSVGVVASSACVVGVCLEQKGL